MQRRLSNYSNDGNDLLRCPSYNNNTFLDRSQNSVATSVSHRGKRSPNCGFLASSRGSSAHHYFHVEDDSPKFVAGASMRQLNSFPVPVISSFCTFWVCGGAVGSRTNIGTQVIISHDAASQRFEHQPATWFIYFYTRACTGRPCVGCFTMHTTIIWRSLCQIIGSSLYSWLCYRKHEVFVQLQTYGCPRCYSHIACVSVRRTASSKVRAPPLGPTRTRHAWRFAWRVCTML